MTFGVSERKAGVRLGCRSLSKVSFVTLTAYGYGVRQMDIRLRTTGRPCQSWSREDPRHVELSDDGWTCGRVLSQWVSGADPGAIES